MIEAVPDGNAVLNCAQVLAPQLVNELLNDRIPGPLESFLGILHPLVNGRKLFGISSLTDRWDLKVLSGVVQRISSFTTPL